MPHILKEIAYSLQREDHKKTDIQAIFCDFGPLIWNHAPMGGSTFEIPDASLIFPAP